MSVKIIELRLTAGEVAGMVTAYLQKVRLDKTPYTNYRVKLNRDFKEPKDAFILTLSTSNLEEQEQPTPKLNERKLDLTL